MKEELVLQEIPASTKAWVTAHATNAVLHFTSNTGAQEQLRVSVKEDVIKRIHGDYQLLTYTFTGQQEHLGFAIQAEKRFADFANSSKQDFESEYLTVNTSDKPNEEYLTPYGVEGELLNNYTLNGQNYNRVLHLVFSFTAERSDKIKEIYYAKEAGIISFTTANGQVWLRQ
ncbi:hypothetical protein [Pontibacter sp. SGAir0037]|uniref:hypothetical protein n=1 Tax=Pontibacter sp. SGAir0037 TaxID=2571030 RepID=UPI0010F67C8B|nr:hypothetical protein [Pontibacter sp. SGAir0037]